MLSETEIANPRGLASRVFQRSARAVALSTCLALGVVAFGPPLGFAEEAHMGGTLRSAWVGNSMSDTLDPTKWLSLLELARLSAVFDRLTQINSEGEPELMLAEAVTPSADARIWTVKLRPGVQFHDGTPLTAEDVLYSFKFSIETGYFGPTNFSVIDLEKSRVVDDLTVEFALTAPNAEFDRIIADASASIFKTGTTDFSETAVGTGPYRIAEWVPGVRTVLGRNEVYWGDPVRLDTLEIIEINDENSRVNALLSGQIDLAINVPPYFADQIDGTPGFSIASGTGATAPIFYMRQDSPPFDQVEVRQALRLAIDREKCVQVALDGHGTVGNDLFGPSYPSYASEIPQRKYNPEKARALLEEAGIEELSVELVTAPGVGMLECATVFKESAKPAGIDISIRQINPADLYNTESIYLQVPFGTTEWEGVSFQEMVRTSLLQTSFANETANNDPEFDAAFAEAEATLDEAVRNEKYAELQRQLWEEGGYIVWGLRDPIIGFSDRVGGYETMMGPDVGFLWPGLGDLWIKQ